MQAIVKVAAGELGQCSLAVLSQLPDFPQRVIMTAPNGFLKGLQPAIMLHDTYVLWLVVVHFAWHALAPLLPFRQRLPPI